MNLDGDLCNAQLCGNPYILKVKTLIILCNVLGKCTIKFSIGIYNVLRDHEEILKKKCAPHIVGNAIYGLNVQHIFYSNLEQCY